MDTDAEKIAALKARVDHLEKVLKEAIQQINYTTHHLVNTAGSDTAGRQRFAPGVQINF